MDTLSYRFLTKLNGSELQSQKKTMISKSKQEVLNKNELASALGIMKRPLQNLVTVLNKINYKKIMENENLTKLGDSEAIRLMGDYYCSGVYGKRDQQKALDYYLEALKQGNEKAADSIRRMLF